MEEQNTTSRKFKIYLSVLTIIVVILIFWLFIQRSQLMNLVKDKETEKTELQHELDSVISEHNKIKLSFGALSDSLSSKDSIIQANAIEIRKLLDTQWEYNKIRKKLTMLQHIAQGYVHQMDSLYTINRELQNENERIRQEVKTEQSRNYSLMKDKEALSEKMNQAAFIKAYDVTVTPYKLKSGGNKEQVTDKATRTDRLKVCFTIGENPLVQSGKKIIYIRIQRPDYVVVTKSKYDTFVFNGQTLSYSIREDISYQGKAINLCVDWTKKDNDKPAMKGRYVVYVYADDTEIGSGTFELK
jgi:regulator of replication initiation timing